MPQMDALCKTQYSDQEWLNYYLNVWKRNLVARLIDVETDRARKAKNPEEKVPSDDGREIPVKERLEYRKMLVQDAVDLVSGIESLLKIPAAEFEANCYSTKALEVAEDMVPPAENNGGAEEKAPNSPVEKKIGQFCTTEAGTPGTLQLGQDGTLKCEASEPAEGEKVATGEKSEEKPAPVEGQPTTGQSEEVKQ